MDKSDKSIYSDKQTFEYRNYINTTKMYIDKFGTKIYYNSKGEYHRIDNPAIEYSNGTKFWYKENKYHRLDGPALEFANGDKEWWVEDKLFRIDGPAIEFANGDRKWYILDKDLEEKEFNLWINRIKVFVRKCI